MSMISRNYRLTIEVNPEITGEDLTSDETFKAGGSQAIVVTMPLTVQFTVVRNASASANSLDIAIYNLSKSTRDKIFQDRFINRTYKRIVLEAGYGDNLSTIFIGSIFEASSARQGSNVITMIHAQDGGFDMNNTKTFRTEAKGSTFSDLIRNLMGDFPNLNQGTLSEIDGTTKRAVVMDGNTFDLIRKYAAFNQNVFVDLENINILNHNDAIEGVVPLISGETILLETPRRQDSLIEVVTRFEPRIIAGQVIELKSTITPQYDGQYKVIGIEHTAIISEAVNGQCQSKFQLLLADQLFGKLNVLPQGGANQTTSSGNG